jgi:hypothetical protein
MSLVRYQRVAPIYLGKSLLLASTSPTSGVGHGWYCRALLEYEGYLEVMDSQVMKNCDMEDTEIIIYHYSITPYSYLVYHA